MLLLSSQQRQQKRSTTSNASSSPSFWIAQAVGALLLCPPDLIERWLPMMAPFPTTIDGIQKRNVVNRILDDCWDNSNVNNNNEPGGYNRKSGYEIQAMDEWIVDNQKQIRDEHIKEENQPKLFPSEESSDVKSQQKRDNASKKSSSVKDRSKADSLFSNYFLSLHLLFSLPTLGEEDDDDGDCNTALDKGANLSSLTMKPSTYGEITPLGTRQLFGAMGLLDRDIGRSSAACHFVDLGSGAGKLVGHALLELPTTAIERATGVESSPSRHNSALLAKQALMEWLGRKETNDSNEWFIRDVCDVNDIDQKLELIEGDLFDVNLSTATHIYVASLCFPDTLMLRLEEMLVQRIDGQREKHQERSNERVAKLQWIATLRQFPNDLGGIQPIIRFMEMSWTSPLGCAVYLYPCDAAQA